MSSMNLYDFLKEYDGFCKEWSAMSIEFINKYKNELGVPLITLGEGSRKVIYISSKRDTEGIGSEILFHFIKDFYCLSCTNASVFRMPIEYIAKKFSYLVIPFYPYEMENSELFNRILFDDSIVAICELGEESGTFFGKDKRSENIAKNMAKLCGCYFKPFAQKTEKEFEFFEFDFDMIQIKIGSGYSLDGQNSFAAYSKLRRGLFYMPFFI